jgi:excisionase family DNA binding protein
MTVAQVAEQLGVSENLVYGWVASGELVHLRFGGRGKRGAIRIEPEALALFIVSRRQGDGQKKAPAPGLVRLKHLKI